MSAALTRRRAAAVVFAGAATAGRASAAPSRRRPMFAAHTLAEADAADLHLAPAGLTTRVSITPQSLVEIVAAKALVKGGPGWDGLMTALAHAASGPPPAGAPREVRVGVVLKRAGETVGSVFTEAAHGSTVFAVVDDRPASVPAAFAEAVARLAV